MQAVTQAFNQVAQYSYDYDTYSSTGDDLAGLGFLFGYLICILVFAVIAYLFAAITLSKIAEKLGHTDQKMLAWIPVAQYYLFFKMSQKEDWTLYTFFGALIASVLLSWIPCVGFIISIAAFIAMTVAGTVMALGVAARLGHEELWGYLYAIPFFGPFISLGYMAFMDGKGGAAKPTQPVATA